jgi:hypothetical protein
VGVGGSPALTKGERTNHLYDCSAKFKGDASIHPRWPTVSHQLIEDVNVLQIKWFDWLIISPMAWVISQSVVQGDWFWMIITYMCFLRYAHGRKEYV